MAMNLAQTKARIKSVSATKKITKAMELVATAKLKTAKKINMQITPYRDEVLEIMSYCAMNVEDKSSIFLTSPKDVSRKLYVIINSTLGLCGGYNINMEKFASSLIDKQNADVILIGNKGVSYFKSQNFHIVQKFDLPSLTIKETLSKELVSYILNLYGQGQYQTVELLSTKFVNSLTFVPSSIQLLPLANLKNVKKMNKTLLFEPTPEEVLDNLIPFYLNTALKALILESMLCEQASRRTAMETANDNANELQDKLLLEFNKSRQASITQEITEISSAANAKR